jgi:hypothetical protein
LCVCCFFFFPGDKDSFERDVYNCAALECSRLRNMTSSISFSPLFNFVSFSQPPRHQKRTRREREKKGKNRKLSPAPFLVCVLTIERDATRTHESREKRRQVKSGRVQGTVLAPLSNRLDSKCSVTFFFLFLASTTFCGW